MGDLTRLMLQTLSTVSVKHGSPASDEIDILILGLLGGDVTPDVQEHKVLSSPRIRTPKDPPSMFH
jgi:hypothetical protein